MTEAGATEALVALQPRKEEQVEIEHLRSRWFEVVNAVKGDAYLRSACEPVALEGDTIILGFYYAFHKERIEDPKYRHMVEQAVSEVFGAPYKICCRLIGPQNKPHLTEADGKRTMTKADRQRERERLIKQSRLPENTRRTHKLERFVKTVDNIKAFRAACNFCALNEDLSELSEEQLDRWEYIPSLTFYGKPGRGKTHLALAIGWNGLEGGQGVLYWQVEDLLDTLRDSFNSDSDDDISFRKIMRDCKTSEILILDDLGAEQSTAWARAKLDEIIDYRYINKDLTVFTTNVPPSKLSERIASRLGEGVIVTLTGEDFRLRKGRERALKLNLLDSEKPGGKS